MDINHGDGSFESIDVNFASVADGTPEIAGQTIELSDMRSPVDEESGGTGACAQSTVLDDRIVCLLKGRGTKNRFYMLRPISECESDIKSKSEEVDRFPKGIRGIAYPCFEDGINDLTIIFTYQQCWDCFDPGEAEAAVEESRVNAVARLTEIERGLQDGSTHFLGMDLSDFQKSFIHHFMEVGIPRKQLDSLIKHNTFEVVGAVEGGFVSAESIDEGETPIIITTGAAASLPVFIYQFKSGLSAEDAQQMTALEFMHALFKDVISSISEPVARDSEGNPLSVEDFSPGGSWETNPLYRSQYRFRAEVLQKYMAVLAATYLNTPEVFHGVGALDFEGQDLMELQDTPLFYATARELRKLESQLPPEVMEDLGIEQYYTLGEIYAAT